jgi:transcriptional regulator with XRE-family HTH domain
VSRHLTVAELVREARKDKGASLRLVAAELGVAPSTLSRVERGDLRMSRDLSKKVASYYGVEPELVEIAEGRLPADLRRILLEHPEEISALRHKYASPGEATEDNT